MFSKEQQLGNISEKFILQELARRGYTVKLSPNFYDKNTDLVIGDLPIEVKFAHKTYRYKTLADGSKKRYPRWQWNIHPTAGLMDGDWVLILVAKDAAGHQHIYVVPGGLVGDRPHIQLTSHPDIYRGWLSEWKNRFDVIDYLAGEEYRAEPVFTRWGTA